MSNRKEKGLLGYLWLDRQTDQTKDTRK